MVSEELKQNTRRNTVEVLILFSDFAEQERYQDAVPFVHVPDEMACLWYEYSNLLSEQAWYRDLFTPDVLVAVRTFDAQFKRAMTELGSDLPELSTLQKRSTWKRLSTSANALLEIIHREDGR